MSWYEAAAYAEFAGKSLPSFFHWYRAAELGIVSDILLLSNFGGEGPAPVGSYPGLGPWGAHDQAGNVREWCWNATYGGERVIAQLYLPRETAPPHQVVVYAPAASALAIRSSEHVGFPDFTFLVRSGRAVLLPVVKGTYERRVPRGAGGPNAARDLRIQQFRDLARSLDWVETRSDLRADRIGYYGLSMGATPAS